MAWVAAIDWTGIILAECVSGSGLKGFHSADIARSVQDKTRNGLSYCWQTGLWRWADDFFSV
ncbi:hypothetical protein Gxy13693_063_028 [Komagataeibacter xylinus NBRC 13693]|uniref:Uncharacterized protein n=1 Tax=Komagataeibacter xylinus NBRC 13693 TaxID=1234668 RepID=A0A0D6QBV3_KOMXY|nr:hypothetical protein Gxy13693_063_028 [Komagataeibacter xylinus NBRC 13693]